MPREAQDPRPGIARNLARMMERRRLSIEELAKRSELSEPRIGRFLEADAEPTATELLRLAGAMEARLSELLQMPSGDDA